MRIEPTNPRVPDSPEQTQAPSDVWGKILACVSKMICAQSFDTWFRPIEFAGCDQTSLRLTVPNATFKKWFLEHFSHILYEAIRQSTPASLDLVVSVPSAASGLPLASGSAGQQDEEGDNGPAPLPVVRASALETAPTRRRWLIEGLWTAQAVGMLGGAPKCLKSFLTLEMAVSVASGSPYLAKFPIHQRGPVLLYAAEDSPSDVRLRLQSLAHHHKLELDQLDISVIAADSLYLDRTIDQDRLAATVRRHRPTLLILDPLVRLHTADENVAGQMAALLGYLRALQRKTSVAILIVHHSRKSASPAAGAGYSLRGSSDLYAWVDSFLYVQRRRGRLTLSSEHRSAPGLGPLAFELVDSSHGPYLELTDPAPEDPSPAIDSLCHQILEVLSSSAQPVTADRLRAILQVRNQRVVETLRTLCGDGKIVRLAQGYALCSNAPLPLQ